MKWQSSSQWIQSTEWYTIPELTDILQLSPGRIRRLLEEHQLLAVRIDNVLRVPKLFIVQNQPLDKLAGTVTLLLDCGFDNDEAVQWLLETNDSLAGLSPIEALRAGRKTEVRRLAQSLA